MLIITGEGGGGCGVKTNGTTLSRWAAAKSRLLQCKVLVMQYTLFNNLMGKSLLD